MAEVEYKGIKVGGSKLLLIIPLLGTIVGGLWGGFEVYQRYLAMEAKIDKFVAPDLSGFDKKLAVLNEQMDLITKEFDLVSTEMELIKESADETAGYARDVKNGLRDDILRIEKIVDQVEDDIKATEGDVRELIDIAEGRFENKRDALQNDYNQKADTIRTDVDTKLSELEARLNKKLQRALDNPLAN